MGGVVVDIEAANGIELIRDLEKADHLPQAVLLDIRMKEMDGFDTMDVLKKKWPDLKVLVLTSSGSELHVIRMIRKGANGYLRKNCHPREIKQALEAIIENDYYYSDVATSKHFSQVRNGTLQLPSFTEMEIQLLKHCPSDLTFDQIAHIMNVSESALDSCKTRICNKLQLPHRNRISLAMYAIEFGLVHVHW
jgi:DNA-binding NarL/FixJ family response regulator